MRLPMPSAPSPHYGTPDDTTPDPGLFGPGSITWRVHGDPSAGLGGVRALLLQALDPESMAGLTAHSDYREDSWGRLFRTAEYVGVTTYGTCAEAERAAARVRGVHRRLGVDDPALLLWVHAGFVDSMLESYQRAAGGLTAEEADRYVAEQVAAASLVGLPPEDVFDDVAGLRAYLHEQRRSGRLRASSQARDGARFILLPPMSTRVELLTPARPAWTALAATAFGLLPRWARHMYGGTIVGPALGGVPGLAERHATMSARAWRRAVLALPESARTGPHVLASRRRLSPRTPVSHPSLEEFGPGKPQQRV